MLVLRDYQDRTIEELWQWFGKHDNGNPIVDACVGAGKSLMIAAVAQRMDVEAPGTRVLVLVHQKELLTQNADKIAQYWPSANVGLYSAGVGRKELGRQITYATIGSIYKQAHKLGRIDVVIADECHLINPKDAGMWRTFLSDLKKYNPHTRVIGWTGTPFRGNGVWLTAGKEPLFTHVATRVTMKELLSGGYLTPLVLANTQSRADTSAVRVSGDDYVVAELAKATDKEGLVESTCEEILKLAADRKRWLVFAVTVEHATHVCAALRRRGVKAAVVSAETPKSERDALIRCFRAGDITCLVNVAVLTTGFDVPQVDFIALLRATKSPVLYVQIAGRGMRLSPGKTDCLWADFTDTTDRMGPVDAVTGRLTGGGGKPGEAPIKNCESCGSQNAAFATVCSSCGAPFPEPERIKHSDQTSTAQILSGAGLQIQTYPVSRVDYRVHVSRNSGQPTLRVDYWDDFTRIASEYVCMSHAGYARTKAELWWRMRSRIEQIPASAEEAIEWLEFDQSILITPASLVVDESGKYTEIRAFNWEQNYESNAARQNAGVPSARGVSASVEFA